MKPSTKKKIVNYALLGALAIMLGIMVFSAFQAYKTKQSVNELIQSSTTLELEQQKKTKTQASNILTSLNTTLLFQVAILGLFFSFLGILHSLFLRTLEHQRIVTNKFVDTPNQNGLYSVVICNVGVEDLYVYAAYVGTTEQTCSKLKETEKQTTHMLVKQNPITLNLDQSQSDMITGHSDKVKVFLSTNVGKVECCLADDIWVPK